MHRRKYLAAVSAAATLGLAGCGGGTGGGNNSSDGGATEVSSTETPGGVETTVRGSTTRSTGTADTTGTTAGEPDVVYVPTPPQVVLEMLRLAEVNQEDFVYDLGSGDGRIPITAAERFGARATGVEIQADLVRESRRNARQAGVSDQVRFIQGDLFQVDISEATAVTLYLLPELNVKVRPKLFRELDPGTPVVSHSFDMGEWEPERTVQIEGRTVYRWTIPDNPPTFTDSPTTEGEGS